MAASAVYQGTVGTTRKVAIHVTCSCGTIMAASVFRSVNVGTHPELRQHLLATDPNWAMNVVSCPDCGASLPVAVPVVFHDPESRLFALVLPDSARHRELDERSALYRELAAEPVAIPPYVRSFAVVYGPTGLNLFLSNALEEARQIHAPSHSGEDLARERAELMNRKTELDLLEVELKQRQEELDHFAEELMARERELDRREQALRRTGLVLARRAATAEEQGRPASPLPAEVPQSPYELFGSGHRDADEDGITTDHRAGDDVTDSIIASAPPPERFEPEERESTWVTPTVDAVIERWKASREPLLKHVGDDRQVRIALSANQGELDPLLSDKLEVRVMLHRFPSAPLVTLAVGSSAALEGMRDAPRPTPIHFNILSPEDRELLQALAREFVFSLELYSRTYVPVRKRTLEAPLGPNVQFVLAAAEEHLSSIDEKERSFAKAVIAFSNPKYDCYGLAHPERKEFREDKLTELETAQKLRRALAMADRFSSPAGEEYLFLVRSYPLSHWHHQRRTILAQAIELGLWMGPQLAQVAVSEALARSRKELVQTLRQNFAAASEAGYNDLDADASSDNWAALHREAASLGLDSSLSEALPPGKRRPRARTPRQTPIESSKDPVASGTIPGVAARALRRPRDLSTDELLSTLYQPGDDIVEVAVELARRRERRAIDPILAVVGDMARTEAVQILSAMPSFGDAATDALVRGLGHHKSFIRQGCALALSVIRNEACVEALSDLLITEPTALWKEVARGLGVAGPRAIMSLASRLAHGNDVVRERVAWALAHVAARGGKRYVRQLAGGRDPIAAGVARHALELTSLAKSEDLQVRGNHTPKEQTVNRAFSRRFFQALEGSSPVIHPSATADPAESSVPPVALEDADLVEASDTQDETTQLLDENDILPT